MNLLTDYLWYFIIYSFLGWCSEVIFATLKDGEFVNRGFLNGPVCPIYGFGAVLVIYTLTPIKENVLILFIGSVILTTLLEGFTGFILEKLFHTHWWDYSSEPFNFKGYVCARFSVLWGFACILIVDVFHPLIAYAVMIIPPALKIFLLVIIFIVFIYDSIITIAGILKFNRYLEQLDKLSCFIKELSDEIGQKLSDKTLETMEIGNDLKEKATEFKENINLKKEQLENTKKEYETLLQNKLSRHRLLKAFPNAKSNQYNVILQKLKELKNKKF